MRFEDKVFIVRNDSPELNAVGLNIPEFKKLRERDKSETKAQYAKELAFVYHMCTYRSPYFDVENKQEAISRDYMGSIKYRPDKDVLAAMRAFDEKRPMAEMRALDAATSSCDVIATDIKMMEVESEEFNKLIKDIDAEIKKSKEIDVKIKLMESKMKLQEQKLKINDSMMSLGVKLEKQIESIKVLRDKVTKMEFNGEMSQILDRFLIDDLVEELKDER